MITYYEIRGYRTKEYFSNYMYEIVNEHLTNKREAIKIAKKSLNEYYMVKVQDEARNYIEIFSRKNSDYIKNRI